MGLALTAFEGESKTATGWRCGRRMKAGGRAGEGRVGWRCWGNETHTQTAKWASGAGKVPMWLSCCEP